MQQVDQEEPPKLITRNGDFEDRIDRLRGARKPAVAIERTEKQPDQMKVSQKYTKERKEFKHRNLEKIKLSETLMKEGLKQKQFYPYVIREPEKVSLKDNKPNIEMKRGRINTNEVVLSRDGQQSFLINQFFNNHPFIECSVQFIKDPCVMPDYDFFVWDAQKGFKTELAEIFQDAAEDMVGSEANEVRKLFRKLYSQASFLDTVHMLVADILPNWATPQEEHKQNVFVDPRLNQMLFPETVESVVQCNDDREDYALQPDHLYFTNIKVMNEYKNRQLVMIKRLNINSKEAEVFSDIRYILHPEKTYFIQIMEEVKQVISTAKAVIADQHFDVTILHQVYELIYAKAQEFLLLICTYIPSSIDLQMRTKKLSEYFWSNFMYMQEIHEVSPEMLEKYNVLASWYSMPARMFGYRREEIQKNFYELVRCGCQIQHSLNFKRKLEGLTRTNVQKIVKRVQKQQNAKKTIGK